MAEFVFEKRYVRQRLIYLQPRNRALEIYVIAYKNNFIIFLTFSVYI